jgi:PAS domain
MEKTLQPSTEQRQASQYARSLIEASLDPLVTISPEGKITDVNEATIKVTGMQWSKASPVPILKASCASEIWCYCV